MPKRTSTALIAYAILVAIVLITGAALTNAGFDEDPFDQLSFMVSFTQNGNAFELGDGGTTFTLPDADSSAASAAAPEGFTLPDLSSDAGSSTTTAETFALPDLEAEDTSAESTTESFALPDLGTETTSESAVDSADSTASSGRPARPDGDFGGGRNGSQALNWSDFGSVLYNLWFMAAVTAIVIPLQFLIRFVMRQTKRRPAAAPAR